MAEPTNPLVLSTTLTLLKQLVERVEAGDVAVAELAIRETDKGLRLEMTWLDMSVPSPSSAAASPSPPTTIRLDVGSACPACGFVGLADLVDDLACRCCGATFKPGQLLQP